MTSRRIVIQGAAVLPALATFGPGTAEAKMKVLKGSVSYRERMALPDGATVRVQLLDVSLADAASVTIAETVITPEGQVPIPYELHYDEAAIVANHSYAVAARIEAEGRLLYISTTRHAVLTGGADDTDIMVERVAASSAAPEGRWLAEDILGGGVLDRVETRLEIGADGGVAGSSGCNAISGTAMIAGDSIKFGPIAATRKACVPAVGDQEQKFFKALGLTGRWHYDAQRQKLTLSGQGGRTLMVLARIG
ncbi:MAG TPA: YbaY family lipoprotein [Albidovulum sp.]|uniref:YbaY family lipoprotein n=1 Tax=Albidovulum sp. TaxID=1872424 RepID=UPI002BE856E7|nr:YbaY family lipoprotein [Albidovulum sp.]